MVAFGDEMLGLRVFFLAARSPDLRARRKSVRGSAPVHIETDRARDR
jgi:hypothetical protein